MFFYKTYILVYCGPAHAVQPGKVRHIELPRPVQFVGLNKLVGYIVRCCGWSAQRLALAPGVLHLGLDPLRYHLQAKESSEFHGHYVPKKRRRDAYFWSSGTFGDGFCLLYLLTLSNMAYLL